MDVDYPLETTTKKTLQYVKIYCLKIQCHKVL